MAPSENSEILQRLTRLESRFDGWESHVDQAHDRLSNGIDELKELLNGQLKEVAELRLQVAQHSWALRCFTAIAVPCIAALTPVLFNHYTGPSEPAETTPAVEHRHVPEGNG